MDFVRSNFGTNELLPVEHFFPHFLAGLLRTHKKWGKNFQLAEVHCTEVTSYKIHILGEQHENPQP